MIREIHLQLVNTRWINIIESYDTFSSFREYYKDNAERVNWKRQVCSLADYADD